MSFLYLSLDNPPRPLGEGLQVWRLKARGSGEVTVELYESGQYLSTPIPTTLVSGTQLVTGFWEASILSNISGRNVEAKIISELDIASLQWLPALTVASLATPASRIGVVETEVRVALVAQESRVGAVAAEERIAKAPTDSRLLPIAHEDRVLSAA